MTEQLIKSKARVKDKGEVFTSQKLVSNMLDLIPIERFQNPLSTWLEPACGTGNFLVEILARKFSHCPSDHEQDIYALKILSTLYGIDIAEDNVEECIERLHTWACEHVETDRFNVFSHVAREILYDNIQVADFLNASSIVITQYHWNEHNTYTLQFHRLTDLMKQEDII
ncbi:TPA: SAM-dependent DNA methyltransferase [Burkholderia vietnamiensis]|nr:SAM-dependent DNA methyltransferase [Burkholderia vietnamiensis]